MALTLADLPCGQSAVLAEFDLSPDDAGRLMELGFLPGARVRAVRAAPGGDPRVFRVDGAEVALRRETARLVMLRPSEP
ncbi:MAG TPA: FeoA family protein [Gemmatimonadales bacterium]